MNRLSIGARVIDNDSPVYIVAEIGTAHRGNIDIAKKLIDAAKGAGADCVKFQAVIAEEIIHPRTGDVLLPGGSTPLFEVFLSVERGADFYAAIKHHAEAMDLEFLCTPFGLGSARILKEIGVSCVKIASPETNHYPLLSAIRGWGIPLIISTGVSRLGDIERAIDFIGHRSIAVLHCVTSYPAPEIDYNVRCIETLSRAFGTIVGVSDHSLDPRLVPVLSVLSGAKIIEKHITLDKAGDGLDDPVALTPTEFSEMVASIRQADIDTQKEVLGALHTEFGREKVTAVKGTGLKILADSEKDSYLTTNRSVLAISDIKAGEIISSENVALLRSEKNLIPGLPPESLSVISGKHAVRDIQNGSGLSWDDVMM